MAAALITVGGQMLQGQEVIVARWLVTDSVCRACTQQLDALVVLRMLSCV
jgi:hypothetical protein